MQRTISITLELTYWDILGTSGLKFECEREPHECARVTCASMSQTPDAFPLFDRQEGGQSQIVQVYQVYTHVKRATLSH